VVEPRNLARKALTKASINAVYADIEAENATFRTGAKERFASVTAAAVGFAAMFWEPICSAVWR